MKRLFVILTMSMLGVLLCGCGESKSAYNIDGLYLTDTAYGMEDFYSEITINGDSLRLYIEHYDVPVEEYNGRFKTDGEKLLFTDGNTDLEFRYNAEEKTIYNDLMETTWVTEEDFIPSKEINSPESDSEEPDPIPENIRGEYMYRDDRTKATLTITEGDYTLYAESNGTEPFEVTGDAVYAGNMMLMTDGENSIQCPLDEKNGTIEYDGFLFKKNK